MKGIKKRGLALLLALALTASLAPAALAVLAEGAPAQDTRAEQTQEQLSGFAFQDDETAQGGLRLPDPGEGSGAASDDGSEAITGTLTEGTGEVTEEGLEPDEDRPSGTGADSEPAADDQVTFIVELEQPSLLAQGYSTDEIADGTSPVRNYEARQEAAVEDLKAQILEAVGDEADVEFGYTYTVASTGLSVTTTYENKEQIAKLPGVDRVYVAPMFHIPETEDQLYPQTSNATTMIGADTVNNTGYTGRGMRIAILDTGLVLTHPSFQALSSSQLTADSMTRDEVISTWRSGTLNASQGSSVAPQNVYVSTKVPFAYNYALNNTDVSHTGAGSDHGTHVAGIAAANRLDSTDVVGVAPDAQLLVMQVFSGDGASWDVVMAALEDCVALDVDVANLSLGSAAGYTDDDQNMITILQRLTDAGIQVVIAAGNDTNSAYNNNFGGYSLAGNPDIGLVGTPSTYGAALSVASADNNAVEQLYFTTEDGREIGYNDTGINNQLFAKYSGDRLEFVVLDGYGDMDSYEGVDVEGKVVVVSRGGGVSFPDKQSIAQQQGAIACVVYNNTAGILNMQVNTGAGDIPCVSIGQVDGQHLIELGNGFITVCNDGAKEFYSDTSMSSFSSWGSAPNLQLKPEITGVGGSIYSTRDPNYNGGGVTNYYGYMSGTSMASPQVAGAMAVLNQYLQQEGYSKGKATWQLAANLLMSTADPIQYSTNLEYSPRQQGAGLVDLVGATEAGAYLSNPDAEHDRPKAEVGESANGSYSFTFQITNISNVAKTYQFDSSLFTETYNEGLIGNQPRALQAKVTVGGQATLRYDFNGDGTITTADARLLLQSLDDSSVISASDPRYAYRDVDGNGRVEDADVAIMVRYCAGLPVEEDLLATLGGAGGVTTVTVPANETVTLDATITLTAADRTYLNQFPNGMYVEGYLYAESTDGDTEQNLTMPILGFYGDWSDAPVFDGVNELDGQTSLFDPVVYTYYNNQLGTNPYIRASQRTGDEYNAVSHINPMVEIDLGLLRNAKLLRFTVVDTVTGQQYFQTETEYNTKTYYSDTYGQVIPYYIYNATLSENYVWNGRNASNGAQVRYTVEAFLDDGDTVADDSWSFYVTMDTQAPQVRNASDLQSALDTSGGRAVLTLDLQDNTHIAAILVENRNGDIVGRYEPGAEVQSGQAFTQEIDVTGLGSDFTITVADYACNETELAVHLTGTEVENPTIQELDTGRLYGSENISVAGSVDLGWFSVNKADLSDARNETFSTDTYFSGEYVDGYVVAQRSDGDVVVLTPYGSYWGSQTIIQSAAAAEGQANFQTLYDMALQYNSTGLDRLFAVGWTYNGTITGSAYGGTNYLYEIVFPAGRDPYISELRALTGLPDGEEMVCLTISDNGTFYGISTSGTLWTIDPDTGLCTRIRIITEFTSLTGFSGVNVIQSMAYDHEQDVIYWAAHSQTPNGYSYSHLCRILKIDTSDPDCPAEIVGTLGHSGASALFVPTQLDSDLFGLSNQPTGFSVSPASVTLLEGMTTTLSVSWSPWNAEAQPITWSSSDTDVATVNNNGVVTAVGEGTAQIQATAQVYNTTTSQMEERTETVTVNVQSAQSLLYGFVATSGGASAMDWITYSAANPRSTTTIGSASHMWQGGAYYEGNLYTVEYPRNTQGLSGYTGTIVYKSTVTDGRIGTPVEISRTPGIEIGNLAIDYNTGRMYGVDLTNGGLAIVDTQTGLIDPLGTFQFSGSVSSSEYVMTAMAIICDGPETTILVGSMNGNLYTVNPDTLACTYVGTAGAEYWNYAAMTYDYNTGNIYWAPSSEGNNPLLLVTLEETSSGSLRAQVSELGYVARADGVEQTVMFTIPEEEPETIIIPVQRMWIEGEEERTALTGATIQLVAQTEPARPTVRAKTWTSSNESVATVDSFGNVTFHQTGTVTITATLRDRNSNVFTDTVDYTVLQGGGELTANLAADTSTGYYGFQLTVPVSTPQQSKAGQRVLDYYNLRAGEYYDGAFYAYEDDGTFLRISASNPHDFIVLGQLTGNRVVDMTFDYSTGTMYALTGNRQLMKVNLNNGSLTQVSTLSQSVYTLAAGEGGALYAAGTSSGEQATVYRLTVSGNTVTSAQVLTTLNAVVRAGQSSGNYNSQMTYDYATDRLYLHAVDHASGRSDGLFMIQLDENGDRATHVAGELGKIALEISGSYTVGNAYLGMLCAIPDESNLPQPDYVTSVTLSATTTQLKVGDTLTLTAQVQPSNTTAQGVRWESSAPDVARVDSNSGSVTAVTPGEATITVTATSNPSISASCTVRVLSEEQVGTTVAYAITQEQGLISFNPKVPSEYDVIGSIANAGNIVGMDVHGSDVYYVLNSGGSVQLYRYNTDSKLRTFLGTLQTYTNSYNDMAYDPTNNMIYLACGLYVYQYYLPNLQSGISAPAGAVMPQVPGGPVNGSVYGVTVVDGKAVALCVSEGRTFLYQIESFSSGTCIFLGWIGGLNLAEGSTEFTYEAGEKRFYVTDGRNELYTFAMDDLHDGWIVAGDESQIKPAQLIGPVGGGQSVTGLAIVNSATAALKVSAVALERQPAALAWGLRDRARTM